MTSSQLSGILRIVIKIAVRKGPVFVADLSIGSDLRVVACPRTLDLNSTWSTMARVAALESVTVDRQRSPVSSSNIDTGWPGLIGGLLYLPWSQPCRPAPPSSAEYQT